jgi:hypothetical protein
MIKLSSERWLSRSLLLPAWLLLLPSSCSACSRPNPSPAVALQAMAVRPLQPPAAQRLGATPEQRDNPLEIPALGAQELRILSPTVLELSLVTTKAKGLPLERWNFVEGNVASRLPPASEISVQVGDQPVSIRRVGFKRRVAYAPLSHRDLRIGNYLILELASPVADDARVQVTNPSEALWPHETRFEQTASPMRFSPVIHVNQEGYMPSLPKIAMIGYYLGSLGELPTSTSTEFLLVEPSSGQEVFRGILRSRKETGQPYAIAPYQQVLQADFSSVRTPGQYMLVVPGLGRSYPFSIQDGVSAMLTRTYALGLLHQRCGVELSLPFTRFVHDRCHVQPAEVPAADFAPLNQTLASITQDFSNNSRHTAPQLKDLRSSLMPFVNSGNVDVSGGHHDAGDYGKYTFNSAQLVHQLVFAVDSLAGVADLDNLGVPESGDGLSDLLQMAKREADFLVKMQDADGGFYYLIHPRDRAYERDVLPDHGDRQAVWPKTTVTTAAAVAALAQAASSPRFKRAFADDAVAYLEAARKGWKRLMKLEERYGRDGSYQRLGHYGDAFMHDDEMAWAATEMFLATGDSTVHQRLLQSFNPDDPNTWHWTWLRMFESYGAAIRSYAFAATSGRVAASALDPVHFARCKHQILLRAQDLVAYASGNAYGTSFPEPTKRYRTAGWYFSIANDFDLAVAYQIVPQAEILNAIVSNINYELGNNPSNVSFLTGVGSKRQHEIVHQYAQNDRRDLPPSGIPLGSVQAGSVWSPTYEHELRDLTFPSDDDKDNPFPPYDRWADTFNVTTEFTVDTLGRGLAATAWLMAQGPLRAKPWRTAQAQIVTTVAADAALHARLAVEGLDPGQARIVWEAQGQPTRFGSAEVVLPDSAGARWVEAEALWPDGRRVSAALER